MDRIKPLQVNPLLRTQVAKANSDEFFKQEIWLSISAEGCEVSVRKEALHILSDL